MRFNTYDEVREAMPKSLPWAIREALIGNIVVENFGPETALTLARVIVTKLNESIE